MLTYLTIKFLVYESIISSFIGGCMSADQISFWSMVGNWVSGIGTLLVILYTIFQNRPKLIAKFIDSNTLIFINNKSVNCLVTQIVPIVVGHRDVGVDLFMSQRFRILKDSDSQICDYLSILVPPGSVQKIDLDEKNIKKYYMSRENFYECWIPRRLKRFRLKICVLNGLHVTVDFPDSFYKETIDKVTFDAFKNMNMLENPPYRSNYFNSPQSAEKTCREIVDNYVRCRYLKTHLKLPRTILCTRLRAIFKIKK
jgi:hypothetical protein